MSNTTIVFYKELTSGWRRGEEPTPETIRQGTVRMEEHPDYEAALQKARDAGFEVRFSGEASIEWTELYNLNQKFVRIEKILNVAKGMRYIDLEHELGHIDQFTTCFGERVPPLDMLVLVPNRPRRDVDVKAGIMTRHASVANKQKIIVEYHNRLVEFLRLYDRGVDVSLLKEHAYGVNLDKKGGVEHWNWEYRWEALNRGMSTSRIAWTEKYFPEMPELEKRYEQAIETIEAGQYTANREDRHGNGGP